MSAPPAPTVAGVLRTPNQVAQQLAVSRSMVYAEIKKGKLTAAAEPEASIFGEHWRDWPREWVQPICDKAGVQKVTAHGIRGLHSTLALEAGIAGAVVAASLGHEDERTTKRSYAKIDAVAVAQQRRELTVLTGELG